MRVSGSRCSYQVPGGNTQDKTLCLFPYAKLPQNTDIHKHVLDLQLHNTLEITKFV